MKTRWIPVVVVVVVVVLVLWTSGRRSPRPAVAEEEPRAASQAAGSVTPPSTLAPLAEPQTVPETRLPAPAAAPTVSPAPDLAQCEIRGRFILPGGAPAVGAAYAVHGWESNEDDVRKYGRPEHWEDLNGDTDADGRVSVRFEPPRAYQFVFDVKAPGHAEASWRWGEILAGEVVDLGEVALVAGATVEGRIVDEEGNVAPGDWYVYVESVGLSEFPGRDETSVHVSADLMTTRFRAEDVMPGRVVLRAHDADWTEDTVIQVRSGEVVEADIRLKRREEVRRVVLEARSRLLRTVCPEAEHVTLTGSDGVRRSPKATRFSFGDFVFEELEPGTYDLTVDDPRFRPWTCHVRPGATVEAELEGTSALALRVLGSDGELLQDYSALVELRNVNFSPNEFDVDGTLLQLTGGVLTGMTPGDYRITVRAGGELGASDVDGLALGETRAVEVRLGGASTVSGRVRFSDGTPASGVQVALLPVRPPDSSEDPFRGSLGLRAHFDEDIQKQEAERDGTFRFALTRPDRYLLHASAPNGAEVTSEELVLQAGAGRDDLELVLPRGARVSGRILAPAGASCAGLRVWIGPSRPNLISSRVEETACALDDDGRYAIGPIPPGEMTARLLLSPQRMRGGKGSFSMGGGLGDHVVLGTLSLGDGEHVERDFEVPEFPGTVALSVRVNGEALAGVGIELQKEVGEEMTVSVHGETDQNGRFGPANAFPGSWSVSVRDVDAGWHTSTVATVRVEAARASQAEIAVHVTEATLLFLDGATGEPLARRWISLLAPAGDWTADFAWQRKETGSDGRATWQLAAGEYRFRLESGEGDDFPFPDPEQAEENPHVVPIVWTQEGPLVREIRL